MEDYQAKQLDFIKIAEEEEEKLKNGLGKNADLKKERGRHHPFGGIPLAYNCRPRSKSQFVSIDTLIKKYPFLTWKEIPSFIVWGPPGTGKTSLAHMLSSRRGQQFFSFSAVTGNLSDLKKTMELAHESTCLMGQKSLLFIDEIHRFNKIQQDALLPHVEEGKFTLIGATTENPLYALNKALLSRLHVVELKEHNPQQIKEILGNALKSLPVPLEISPDILDMVAQHASGDGRKAINALEIIVHAFSDCDEREGKLTKPTLEDLSYVKNIILQNARKYDAKQDRHYDVISAFIKSMRGSDPNATLLWLAIMIDGGEDPVFIARRMIIFASEDVGLANPLALPMTVAALEAVKNIGMPEARINLAHVATFLATCEKSNSTYMGIDRALEYVRERKTIEVPENIRSKPTHYQYPHSFENSFVAQNYSGEPIPQFYQPTRHGMEKIIQERMERLWSQQN
jgi:putative ATPase